MPITDLLPRRKTESKLPLRRAESDPFYAMQREMDRLFDEFIGRGTGLRSSASEDEVWDAFSPRVNVVESEKEITVSAELPGMDSKDIDISYTGGMLTISGEKRQEKEDKGKTYYRTERSYGYFTRSVQLPCEVDLDKVDAKFKNGVLQVSLPKIIESGECRRITVKTS